MFTMINKEEFTERLTTILKYYNLSAASFAEKIEVQRSSISHLLSGRNKPSLDFVLRTIHVFKEVNLYWLLKGEGSFPAKQTEQKKDTPTLTTNQTNTKEPEKINTKSIDKIIVFYTDGSFKSYTG